MVDQPFVPDPYWQQVLDADDYDELVSCTKPNGPARLTFNPELAPLLRACVFNEWTDAILPPTMSHDRDKQSRLKMLLDCIDEQFPHVKPRP